MSNKQTCHTVTIRRERNVTVYAETPAEAEAAVREMYENGDSVTDLGDVQFVDVRETDEDGNEFLNVYIFSDDETATSTTASPT